MLPSLRIIFYRLCNLFSPGYTWKHGLRKPSNKLFFFQTYRICFGIFGLVDCVVLCGILITFSLHILSLLPSPWFCTNQPFLYQNWPRKADGLNYCQAFRSAKVCQIIFRWSRLKLFRHFNEMFIWVMISAIKNLEPRHYAFVVRACK